MANDDDLIRRGDALSACRDAMTLDGSLQRIAALPAVTVGVPEAVIHRSVLDWIRDDTGAAIKMTITPDQANALTGRILAALEPQPVLTANPVDDSRTPDPVVKPAPDAAAIREALLSLPAVYAHQINTGVREVYDPLQRFYRMEDVLSALAAHVNEPPKSKHDAGNVLMPAPAAMTPEVEALVEAIEDIRDYATILATPKQHDALRAALDGIKRYEQRD